MSGSVEVKIHDDADGAIGDAMATLLFQAGQPPIAERVFLPPDNNGNGNARNPRVIHVVVSDPVYRCDAEEVAAGVEVLRCVRRFGHPGPHEAPWSWQSA